VSNEVRLVQVVVADLAAATTEFSTFLGAPSKGDQTPRDTVRFPVTGLGVLELIAPEETSNDPLRVALAAALRSKGDGITTLGIEVDDVRVRQRELEAAGVGFLLSEPYVTSCSAWNATTPETTHGLVVKLCEERADREGGRDAAMSAIAPLRARVCHLRRSP
jgi:hypothetical protein